MNVCMSEWKIEKTKPYHHSVMHPFFILFIHRFGLPNCMPSGLQE